MGDNKYKNLTRADLEGINNDRRVQPLGTRMVYRSKEVASCSHMASPSLLGLAAAIIACFRSKMSTTLLGAMCSIVKTKRRLLEIVISTTFKEPLWTYDDETNWPGVNCKEGGKRQSPIDIRTADVVKDYAKQFIKHGQLKFTGYHRVLVSGINNGHTVQFSSEGEEAIHPTLTGGPLEHRYRLEQLHFHWLSEHSVNGIKFPMEIHFVHVRSDLNVGDALVSKDGLAIISVFCNVQAELDDRQQQASDEIMQYIPKLLETGDRISGVLMDMTKLLSPNQQSYYTYAGSLTSPECNEAVIWIIFDTPIFLSDADYRMFGKVGVGRHNFRSLQKLNHHVVFKPVSASLHTPQIVKLFDDVVKLVTDFFRNVTSFMSKGLRSR
ncbi:carbonic anhydrase 1-like [Ostrinia furnacalis]|uniref:carbonic anhydrase 1-like n=1 Tax=Ostrinia furnacalis TaxID=93504 RepID=UPI00103AEAB6|nr:carbonic anhydrase 1-like [Ostrinia furnacalis]